MICKKIKIYLELKPKLVTFNTFPFNKYDYKNYFILQIYDNKYIDEYYNTIKSNYNYDYNTFK
jgi:hypothetical protein